MTLRQYRSAIGAMVVLLALITALIAMSPSVQDPVLGESLTWYMMFTPVVLGGVFAVFWAAPLVSREYENRTHLFAWGQDVGPVRWLASKVVVLAGIAAGLSAIVGAFARSAVLDPVNAGLGYQPFDPQAFESSPHLMAAYTLFGFGLGLLASAVIRQTLPAMGLTLFLFASVRVVVGDAVRPYYFTPVYAFEDWSRPFAADLWRPPGSMYVDGGLIDAAGAPVNIPQKCQFLTSGMRECAHANGVAGNFSEYQPAERIPVFQWIETGIYLGLAAILFTIAFVWVRRVRRV